jgi:hypothetical protein
LHRQERISVLAGKEHVFASWSFPPSIVIPALKGSMEAANDHNLNILIFLLSVACALPHTLTGYMAAGS